jgi:hypothetical protein
MNEDNYQFLTRALGKLGFEDSLNDALRTKMQLNMSTIDLKAKVTHGQDSMTHELHFERKKENGFYFLNSQQVTLSRPGKEDVTQSFPFYNQKGFSNDEAHNLMSGRSVHNTITVEGQSIPRWTYIDFNSEKNKKGNYVFRNPKDEDLKYDLLAAVSKLPIQNMSPAEKEGLLKSLRNGDLVESTLKVDGRWEKTYLEANPQMRMINVYNSDMQKITLSNNKIQVLAEENNVKPLPDATTRILNKEQSQGQGQSKKISNG